MQISLNLRDKAVGICKRQVANPALRLRRKVILEADILSESLLVNLTALLLSQERRAQLEVVHPLLRLLSNLNLVECFLVLLSDLEGAFERLLVDSNTLLVAALGVSLVTSYGLVCGLRHTQSVSVLSLFV